MAPTARLPQIHNIASYSVQDLIEALEYLHVLCQPTVRGSRRRRRASRSYVTKNDNAALSCLDSFERNYTLRWLTALISHLETQYTITDSEALIQSAASLLALCSGAAAAGTFHRDFVFASNHIPSCTVTVRVKDMPLNNHDYSSVGAQTWGGACVLSESIVDEPWKFGLCYPPQLTMHLCKHTPSATLYFTAIKRAVPQCQPLRILELGAGTGLVSLTVGKLLETLISSYRATSSISPSPLVSPPVSVFPLEHSSAEGKLIPISTVATIVATDYYPPVLENLESNVMKNFSPIDELNKDQAITIKSYPLDWSRFSSMDTPSNDLISTSPKPFDKPFDVIFGADIIYELEHASWIKSCLSVLLRKPSNGSFLKGIYTAPAENTNFNPSFHLVIPLRSTHAKESRTIELVFPFSESFGQDVCNDVNNGGGGLELCILSKEVIVCETEDGNASPDDSEDENGDDGEGGVAYLYYRIGWSISML